MALFKKGDTLPLKRVKHDLTDDCYVFIRELSAQEQVAFQSKMNTENYKERAIIWDVIALCVCYEGGKPLFTVMADVAEHFKVGISQAQKLVEAILDLSGFKTKN